MDEENSGGSITIKKTDMWKYSTFLLLAVIIVGAIVFFNGNNNGGTTTGNVVKGDLSFAEDAKLYPSIGPKDAKVTVISFYDFQCPYCAIATGLPAFAQQYASQYADLFGMDEKLRTLAESGKIRVIYATMSFLGSESTYAAEALLAASEQGKGVEMHDIIFSAHDGKENNGKYSKENLKKLASGISGLDQSKFASALDSGKFTSTVSKLSSNANGAGVSGTPAFMVNGEKVSASWPTISAKLNALGVSA